MAKGVIDHKDEPATTIVLLCGHILKLSLNTYVYSIRDFVEFSVLVLLSEFFSLFDFVFIMDTD